MSTLPVPELHTAAPENATRLEREKAGRTTSSFRAPFGWGWRLLIGGLACFNYFSSVLVVGWTYRWMQGLVLRGWWQQSPRRGNESFEEFCQTLGLDAPVRRPRWLLQERMAAHVHRRKKDGRAPGKLTVAMRVLVAAVHSLWRNAAIGIQGVFCTYLLTGWGCLLMVFSWWYGWLNSFHKGYEEAFFGLLTGVAGIALFIGAMLYVPLAQVHQAATGSIWAFFDFRFVWRLVRVRLAASVLLAALFMLASLPLEVLKTLPVGFYDMNPALADAPDAVQLKVLQAYLLACCFVLFILLLLTRAAAARLYRRAVVQALRDGWVTRSDLHPVLAGWLDRLDLYPEPRPRPAGLKRVARFGGRFVARGLLYGMLVMIWLLFVAKVYAAEFFNYHPVVGLMNHVLVQFPCFDFVPGHLK